MEHLNMYSSGGSMVKQATLRRSEYDTKDESVGWNKGKKNMRLKMWSNKTMYELRRDYKEVNYFGTYALK